MRTSRDTFLPGVVLVGGGFLVVWYVSAIAIAAATLAVGWLDLFRHNTLQVVIAWCGGFLIAVVITRWLRRRILGTTAVKPKLR
jgi:hypothetical protein